MSPPLTIDITTTPRTTFKNPSQHRGRVVDEINLLGRFIIPDLTAEALLIALFGNKCQRKGNKQRQGGTHWNQRGSWKKSVSHVFVSWRMSDSHKR